MMSQVIHAILPPIIGILELMGVFIVAWTGGKSFWYFLQNAFRKKHFPIQYELASGMAIALAFKMAAEILKTVLVDTLEELAVLGVIVVLRGIMSMLLHFELKHSKQDLETERELSPSGK